MVLSMSANGKTSRYTAMEFLNRILSNILANLEMASSIFMVVKFNLMKSMKGNLMLAAVKEKESGLLHNASNKGNLMNL